MPKAGAIRLQLTPVSTLEILVSMVCADCGKYSILHMWVLFWSLFHDLGMMWPCTSVSTLGTRWLWKVHIAWDLFCLFSKKSCQLWERMLMLKKYQFFCQLLPEIFQGLLSSQQGLPCGEYYSVQRFPAWNIIRCKDPPAGNIIRCKDSLQGYYSVQIFPAGILFGAKIPCREYYSVQIFPAGNIIWSKYSLSR